MKRIPVTNSSNIAAWGYDPQAQCLDVEFLDGAIYRYTGVTPLTAEGFHIAESKGKFVHAYLKGKFESSKLPEPEWIPDPTDITLEESVALIKQWQRRWSVFCTALQSIDNRVQAERSKPGVMVPTAQLAQDVKDIVEKAFTAESRGKLFGEEQVSISARSFLILNQTIAMMRRDIYQTVLGVLLEVPGTPREISPQRIAAIKEPLTHLCDLYGSNRDDVDILGPADWNWYNALVHAAKRALLRQRRETIVEVTSLLPDEDELKGMGLDVVLAERKVSIDRLREWTKREGQKVLHPNQEEVLRQVTSELDSTDTTIEGSDLPGAIGHQAPTQLGLESDDSKPLSLADLGAAANAQKAATKPRAYEGESDAKAPESATE